MTESRRSAEQLARLILGDPDSRDQACLVLNRAGDTGWSEVLNLASAWRLIPQLQFQLGLADVSPPSIVESGLSQLAAAGAAHSALVMHTASSALQSCHREGIAIAAFKGVAAIAGLYESAARRMVNDADVLLPFSQLAPAMEILQTSGFTPATEVDMDRWQRVLSERVLPIHDFIVLRNTHGVEIDVHWRIGSADGGNLDIETIISRSSSIRFQRFDVPVVAAIDAVILTAHHTLRERFRPHVAIKDLYDQSHWLAGFFGPADAGRLIRQARASGLETALLASWQSLQRMDSSSAAAPFLAEVTGPDSGPARETAGQIAELFDQQLREGEISEAVLGLCSMTPAMVLRFISSRWRRLTDQSGEARAVREHAQGGKWKAFKRLVRNLFRLNPKRYGNYRALARENRRFIGVADKKMNFP